MTKNQIFGTALALVAVALLLIVRSMWQLTTAFSEVELVLLSASVVVLVIAACLAYFARPSKGARDK